MLINTQRDHAARPVNYGYRAVTDRHYPFLPWSKINSDALNLLAYLLLREIVRCEQYSEQDRWSDATAEIVLDWV